MLDPDKIEIELHGCLWKGCDISLLVKIPGKSIDDHFHEYGKLASETLWNPEVGVVADHVLQTNFIFKKVLTI